MIGGAMRKGFLTATISLLIAISAIPGHAEDFGGFFGQLSTAEAVPPGAVDLGAYAGLYEDANALFGMAHIGVMPYADLEFKAGVLDTEGGSDPHAMIGSAFKYHVYDRQESSAPDMAVSALIEYYSFDNDGSVWIFGTGFIGSYPIRLSNDSDLTPYGRLTIRAEKVSFDRPFRKDYEDTDFDIGFNFGVQYAPVQRFQLYGEFQLDDQIGFIAGINFAVH